MSWLSLAHITPHEPGGYDEDYDPHIAMLSSAALWAFNFVDPFGIFAADCEDSCTDLNPDTYSRCYGQHAHRVVRYLETIPASAWGTRVIRLAVLNAFTNDELFSAKRERRWSVSHEEREEIALKISGCIRSFEIERASA